MLARLQQLTTFALLCAAIAWAAWALSRGEWGQAVLGVLLILFGHALVLGVEFVWMAVANRRDRLPAPRAAEVLAAWWGEVRSAPRVFCWQQPFRWNATPDHLEGHPGQRGVLLVHGFVCNRGLWNRWYPRLRAAGVPYVGVNLDPVFGEIEGCLDQIDAGLAVLQARTGHAPVVVAHSMGGLAVRAWLRSRGGDAAMQRVHHVVTLGSPHGGTTLARFGLTPNARQMRRDSEWLQALAKTETPALRGRVTCLYSNCDNIVFPTSTATLPDATNHALSGCAHVQMVDHPVAFDIVWRCLQEDLAPGGRADPAVSAALPVGA